MHLFSFYRLRGSENFHYPLVYKINILRPWRDFCGFLGRYQAILSEHMLKFNVLDFCKILLTKGIKMGTFEVKSQKRTKCVPKYMKSTQCGPNVNFADLFGSTVRVMVYQAHWAGGQSHGLAWVRVMVRHVYIVPSESSHVEYPQVRLGQVLGRHDPLGRRLESWFGLGQSHGQKLFSFLGRGCKNKQLSFPQLLLI